jgi:hypothetical protein
MPNQKKKKSTNIVVAVKLLIGLFSYFKYFRGGKLKYFMFFDLFSAFLCIALFLALSITDGKK